MYKSIHITLFVLMALITSCSNDDDCVAIDITKETLSLTQSDCDVLYGMKIKDINSSNNLLIISSQTQVDNQIEGNCIPDIDFSKYNLIIGHAGSLKEVESFSHTLVRSVEDGIYRLNVHPKYSNVDKNSLWFYQILVPKKEDIVYVKLTFTGSNN